MTRLIDAVIVPRGGIIVTARFAIFVLFLLSGATSLVYEVVWLRKLTLIFGSTQFATSTILSIFMAGLALGAFLAGRQLTRTSMPALKIYGLLEVGIGLYALLVPLLFAGLSPFYQALWNAGLSDSFVLFSLARFGGIAVVLLPPTMMMGATLPVLARQIADDPRRIGGKVGMLYAVNTIGAVAGTVLAGFVLVPRLGVRETLWVAAVVNGLLGLIAWRLAGRLPRPGPRGTGDAERGLESPSDVPSPTHERRRLRVVLFVFGLSGFGALALEVAWTRVLALVMGSSVYAFTLMLLAFLLGLAAGSASFAAYLRRRHPTEPAATFASLLVIAGLLAYATSWAFRALPRAFAEVYFWTAGQTDWLTGAARLSADQWMIVQFLLGLAVMFPATFALGGLFPVVLQLHARELSAVGVSVGTVYASNTAGTIVGAAVAGFALIPAIGMLHTVTAIAVLEVLLGGLVLVTVVRGTHRLRPAILLAVALVCGLVFRLPEWDVQLMNSGVYMNLFGEDWTDWADFSVGIYQNNETVFAEEGWTSTVYVADQPRYGNRYLSVNGKVEASTKADLETQLLCSHVPLLLHEDPKDVLVIGLASGISAGAAATHAVETIRIVEVEKAMERAARLFSDHNNGVLDDPRVVLSFNDARNDLQFTARTYDVIISEPSNPWMTVAANLFTEEFFELAKTRLRSGGVFSQWIQNYSLPTDDLRSIIAAFRKSFRYVLVFESYGGIDVLLMGSQDRFELDLERLRTRMLDPAVVEDLGRIGLRQARDVLQFLRIGPDGVDKLVEGAPRNTDNNARVEFSAPRNLARDTLHRNREFLGRFADVPPQGPGTGAEEERGQRRR